MEGTCATQIARKLYSERQTAFAAAPNGRPRAAVSRAAPIVVRRDALEHHSGPVSLPGKRSLPSGLNTVQERLNEHVSSERS